MGTLRALTIEPQGYEFNGVTLGEPVELDDDPCTFEWDDSRFPNGKCEVINGELIVTPDEVEGI
jgi:hypothetical protein